MGKRNDASSWAFPGAGLVFFGIFLIGAAASAQNRMLVLSNTFMALLALTFLATVLTLFLRSRRSATELEFQIRALAERDRELAERSEQLNAARADIDIFMDTVDQGIFSIDSKYKIQGRHSRSLERIFHLSELEGYNLLNVLEPLLDDRTFDTARDYLNLLFDKSKKERVVLRVNPLERVEVKALGRHDASPCAFLRFFFRRIVENGEITRVFVSVSDISESVEMAGRLRESEQRRERQCEFLLWVLHADPKHLEQFLQKAEEQAAFMGTALQKQSADCLDVLCSALRSIEGVAAPLRLQYFQNFCGDMQEKIAEIRNAGPLENGDSVFLNQAHSSLRADLDEIRRLREKFAHSANWLGLKSRLAPIKEEEHLSVTLSSLAAQFGSSYGREVRLDMSAFDTHGLSDAQYHVVKNVLVQLVKNAVMHGIEESRLRELLNKPRVGLLTVRRLADASDKSFSFSFRDDGRGLDPARIRARALEQGLISAEESAKMSEAEVVGLIFRSGFSTLEEMTFDAGWGAGMSVVKEAVIEHYGGEIIVNSELGSFTELSFYLPAPTQTSAQALAADGKALGAWAS